jgi:hypothetical protein
VRLLILSSLPSSSISLSSVSPVSISNINTSCPREVPASCSLSI